MRGRRIEIEGVVQGVGFRPWVYRLAREEGIAGRVRNGSAGVTIEAFGSEAALESFLSRLEAMPPPAAAIRHIGWQELAAEAPAEFRIEESDAAGARRVSIPADLATCPDCEREIFDPEDRRYRYAFTNCTNCGPRFTIAQDVPYDRAATTMARFTMCPECQREYEDPENRRFHAQPNACPRCGPRLELRGPEGRPVVGGDPLRFAAWALAAGRIVAIRGLGGFHLACRATSAAAVARLRQRKRREAKPLAVMVKDLAAARRVADLTPEEEELLTSVERPIVLARRRPRSGIADEVAPDNPLVGLLLPYTPLHHLLLTEVGFPLVMTSGNLSEEPIAYRNEEAVHRLRGIADLFLVHDREIASYCDDSVARVIDGAPLVMRRSRGFVPRPVTVPQPFAAPVLACGGDLKNAFCLGVGDRAYLGPHIGDLENLETLEAYREEVERMIRFVGVEPEIVAHDLHPRYHSVRFAQRMPQPDKVGVQHHHAHLLSCLAENGRQEPALGVVFDGTGYGTDGTAWGGEILVGDASGYERLATLRALPLPGGDVAIREVWRIALALVRDAFDGNPPEEALALVRARADRRAEVLRLLGSRFPIPMARGAGRYFDGVGALVLGRDRARFEGEVAQALNLVAVPCPDDPYPWEVGLEAGLWTIDLRPAIRMLVADLLTRVPEPSVAGRFHETLIRATAEVAATEACRSGLPVALTGGCFQNDLLTHGLRERLESAGIGVLLHREIPPGDGGLALGQAVAAGGMAR
jgi:hydrogenase maturation protein HypF